MELTLLFMSNVQSRLRLITSYEIGVSRSHVWQSYDVTALFTTITSRILIKIMSKNNLIEVSGVYATAETLQYKMNKCQKRKNSSAAQFVQTRDDVTHFTVFVA